MAKLVDASKRALMAEIPFIGYSVGAVLGTVAAVEVLGRVTGWWSIVPIFTKRGKEYLLDGEGSNLTWYGPDNATGTRVMANWYNMRDTSAIAPAMKGVGGFRIGRGVKAKMLESPSDYRANTKKLAATFGSGYYDNADFPITEFSGGWSSGSTSSDSAWDKAPPSRFNKFLQAVFN